MRRRSPFFEQCARMQEKIEARLDLAKTSALIPGRNDLAPCGKMTIDSKQSQVAENVVVIVIDGSERKYGVDQESVFQADLQCCRCSFGERRGGLRLDFHSVLTEKEVRHIHVMRGQFE